MKPAAVLNNAVNVTILIVVGFLLFRPSGPIGQALTERRKSAELQKDIAASWPLLQRQTSRLDTTPGSATLVEFSDFECPFCKNQDRVLRNAMAHNPNLRVVYAHYPLDLHHSAEGAARAAICAEDRGKFREISERFFQNTEWQRDTNWTREASLAGVDTVGFVECMRSKKTSERLAEDKRIAVKLGITGTPSFVGKSRIFVGVRSDSALAEMAKEPNR